MKIKIITNVLYDYFVLIQGDGYIRYIKLYLLLKRKKSFISSLVSNTTLFFHQALILLNHLIAY